MNKLSKDQIQKIVLGVMLLFGVVYGYFEFLLGPLAAGRAAALKETEALGPKIAAARQQILKAKNLEEAAPTSQRVLDQVNAMIPDGAPIAWVPTRLTELFKHEGVDKVSARMISELSDKEIPGYSKIAWSMEFPQVEVLTIANAIAALENREPLMEIQSLEIEAGRENVQFQRVSLTLHNIVRL